MDNAMESIFTSSNCLQLVKSGRIKPGKERELQELGLQFFKQYVQLREGQGEDEVAELEGLGGALPSPADISGYRVLGEDQVWALRESYEAKHAECDKVHSELASLTAVVEGLKFNVTQLESDRDQLEVKLGMATENSEALQELLGDKEGHWDSERTALLSDIKRLEEAASLQLPVEQEQEVLSSPIKFEVSVSFEQELGELKEEKVELTKTNKSLQSEIEQLNKGMVYAKTQFQKLKAAKDQKSAEVKSLKIEMHDLETAKNEAESLLSTFKQSTAQRQQELESELEAVRKLLESEQSSHTQSNEGLEAELHMLQETNTGLLEELENVRTRETAVVQTMREIEVERDAVRGQLEVEGGKVQEVESRWEAEVGELNQRVDELEAEKVDFEGKMRYAKQQFEKLKKQSDERKTKIEELKEVEVAHTALLEEVDVLRSRIDELESSASNKSIERAAEVQSQLENAENEMQQLRQALELSESMKLQLEQQVSEAQQHASQSAVQFEDLQNNLSTALSTIQELEACLESRDSTIHQQESRISDLEQYTANVQEQDQQLQNQLSETNSTLVSLQEELAARDGVINEKMDQISTLEGQIRDLGQVQDSAGGMELQLNEALEMVHNLQSQLAYKEDEMAEKAKLVSDLEVRCLEVPQMEEQLNLMNGQFGEAQDKVRQLESLLVSRDEEVGQKVQEVRDLEQRVDDLLSMHEQAAGAQFQLDEALNNLRSLEQTLSARDAELEAQSREVGDLREQLAVLGAKGDQCDSLQMQLDEALGQLRTVQEELAGAAEQISTKDGLLDSMNHQHVATIEKYEQEMAEALEIAELADEKSRELEAHLHHMGAELNDARNRVEALTAQIEEKDSSTGQAAALEEQLAETQSSLDTMRGNLGKADVEVQGYKARLEVADNELASLRQDLAASEQRCEQLTSQVSEMEVVSEQDRVRTRELQVQASQLNDKHALVVELEKRCGELSAALDERDSDIVTIRTDASAKEERVRELEASMVEAAGATGMELEAVRGRLESVNGELESCRQELTGLAEQRNALEQQLTQATQRSNEAESLRRKVVQLETALAIANPASSFASMPSSPYSTPPQSMPSAGPSSDTATPVPMYSPNAPPQNADIMTRLNSLSKRAMEAELREASLRGELEEVRTNLESEQKLRADAQSMIEELSRHGAGARFDRSSEIVEDTTPLQGALTNKKNEDNSYDVEAAVLSGGDPSGFQPVAGLMRGVPFARLLGPCIKGADYIDRGFIVLMRQPVLRTVLLLYFFMLHIVAFAF